MVKRNCCDGQNCIRRVLSIVGEVEVKFKRMDELESFKLEARKRWHDQSMHFLEAKEMQTRVITSEWCVLCQGSRGTIHCMGARNTSHHLVHGWIVPDTNVSCLKKWLLNTLV